MSVSPWFLAPSEQVARAQKIPDRMPESQAAASRSGTTVPGRHFAHLPPQSMPFSRPLSRPSVQLGATHLPPAPQTSEAQSREVRQSLSAPHGRPMRVSEQAPPQSTSVSLWFLTPSSHDGSARQERRAHLSPVAETEQTPASSRHSACATHAAPSPDRHTPDTHVRPVPQLSSMVQRSRQTRETHRVVASQSSSRLQRSPRTHERAAATPQSATWPDWSVW